MATKINIPEIKNTDALEHLGLPVIIFDNTQIYYINQEGFSLLGTKKSGDFFNKKPSIFNFLLPEYHKKIRENNKSILAGKSFDRNGVKIKCPNGNIYFIESRSTLILFNQKRAIQTIIIEITERKNKEEKLFKTEELFSLLNKHVRDVFFKLDFQPKTNYSFISDSIKDNLGYDKKDFITNPKIIKSIIHPEDKNKLIFSLKDYKKLIQSKTDKSTLRFIHKNGNIVWLQTMFTPVKDKKGNIISLIGISRNISDQEYLQGQLNEARKKFDLIAENADEIVYFFTYQPKPKYLFVSPSVKKVLGYNPDELYKDPFFINKRTIGKKNDLKVHEKIASSEQKRSALKPKKIVYQVTNAEGQNLWMEDNITPVKDEKGKIKFLFGLVRNITELKEKEREVNQKWSDYKLLLDQSPISFFIHNNGVCLMCNKAAIDLLKVRSEKQIIGTFIIDYIIPEQRSRAIERMRTAVKGTEFDFLGYQITNTKGKIINVEIKTVPIRYNGIDCVLSLVKDISEREKYEKGKIKAELTEEHNKELINQRNKLSAIFDSSSHLVWTVNRKLEITYFNSNYKKLIKEKYGKEPVINKPLTKIVAKKQSDELAKLWDPFYKKVLRGEYIEFERKDSDRAGNEVYREVYLSPIFNDKGEVFEIACLAHDITQSKLIEKQNIAQSSKIKAIFESGTHIMWTVNRKLNYTSFNNNFSETMLDLYGKRPQIEKSLVMPKGKERAKDHRLFWEEKYNSVFNGRSEQFITERVNRKGQKKFRQIYLHPIIDEKNQVVEVSGMGVDITENVLNEQKISLQAAKLNAVFEGSSHYIWTINHNNELTSFNKNYADLIKKIYGISSRIGTVINKGKMVSKQDYNNWWNKQYQRAFKGEAINFETVFTNNSGSKVCLDVFLSPVYRDKDIVEVSGIAHDITERIKNEERIKEQSAKLKAIFESGSQLMWTINQRMEITSFNQNYANAVHRLYGFYPEINKSIRKLDNGATKPYQSFWDEKYNIAFSGTPTEFTTERFNRDGSKVYRQYVLYPIKDQNNEVLEVSGLGIDITENKLYEERITQSLKEKEVLLKEVHHRVKNNMQVISSILNLQSSYVTDNYALNLLKESQNRIKTMAYIHESLYQNKTFSSINFNEYITTLTNNILHSYTASIQKVKLVMDLQKVLLNLDTSIPAGLIINELVTNAIKHAFVNQNEGNIYINLFTQDNVLFLEVSDDGSGFPASVDFKNTNSLGLQLVNTLIEQLNGNIELKKHKEKGTSFLINFPM